MAKKQGGGGKARKTTKTAALNRSGERPRRRAAATKRRKDLNVLRSSHGKFKSVEELEAHRLKVSPPKPTPTTTS